MSSLKVKEIKIEDNVVRFRLTITQTIRGKEIKTEVKSSAKLEIKFFPKLGREAKHIESKEDLQKGLKIWLTDNEQTNIRLEINKQIKNPPENK